MSKAVKIVVVDRKGNGEYGHTVKEYGGSSHTTDRNGAVTLFLEKSNTTVYVNGQTAYDGSVSRMDSIMVFDSYGRQQ